MSFVNQELDQLSTRFSASIGIGGDSYVSQVDSGPAEIGNSQPPGFVNAATPLEAQSSSSSLSSETIALEVEGCTPSSLRRTHSSNGSTNDNSNAGSHSTNATSNSDSPIITASILDEEYAMNHKSRGLCLIFNHEEFDNCGRRSGTEQDAYCLKKSFEYLGFEVQRYDNLRCSEIIETLALVSESDHSDADCFCCCILTHGEGEHLHARDQPYAKNSVFGLFTGEKCPTLRGKPKIFFIQACRGTNTDHGVQVDCHHDAVQQPGVKINQVQCIPVWADFLISYSTVEGYYSYRHTAKGGWFVQALTPILEALGTNYDLVSILTAVNKDVAFNLNASPGKQIPQIVCTLTKKLIFRSKPYPVRRLTQFIAGDSDSQQIQSPNNALPPDNSRVTENS
ncbi:caspase-6 [Tetranychus urticae]|uniref:Caspase family p20 domain-containing protein n=1 Tax=Tetranychus urticae TaxID=32264 RepID=T1K3I7_TETUR|nr:caspase-6 [Tetranychus urticae]XP_015781720.1 caspase-6 [Tetranychus urticae]XP_015781722.1 caspase-6 [Tetranychus urticae]